LGWLIASNDRLARRTLLQDLYVIRVGRAYMLKGKKQMTGQANVNAAKLKARQPLDKMPIRKPRFCLANERLGEASLESVEEEGTVDVCETAPCEDADKKVSQRCR
jgi:hypothetical protein